jgi:hypothetical protein
MPGFPPKPPEQRTGRHVPRAGEWQHAPATGWQHGAVPKPPTGIGRQARAAWPQWFGSWVASFWRPEDVHALRAAILLYDSMLEKPTPSTATALGQYLDRFGLTPKGLQDRRWRAPENTTQEEPQPTASKYRRLRVINE